jgi:hypothetical protein
VLIGVVPGPGACGGEVVAAHLLEVVVLVARETGASAALA